MTGLDACALVRGGTAERTAPHECVRSFGGDLSVSVTLGAHSPRSCRFDVPLLTLAGAKVLRQAGAPLRHDPLDRCTGPGGTGIELSYAPPLDPNALDTFRTIGGKPVEVDDSKACRLTWSQARCRRQASRGRPATGHSGRENAKRLMVAGRSAVLVSKQFRGSGPRAPVHRTDDLYVDASAGARLHVRFLLAPAGGTTRTDTGRAARLESLAADILASSF